MSADGPPPFSPRAAPDHNTSASLSRGELGMLAETGQQAEEEWMDVTA